jgi:hypothetical protein
LAKDLQEESNYMLDDAKTSFGKVFGQGKESSGVNDREIATYGYMIVRLTAVGGVDTRRCACAT